MKGEILTSMYREKKQARKELEKYIRHIDFIELAEKYGHCDNIDFDCYWSWYHHSKFSAQEALKRSIIE